MPHPGTPNLQAAPAGAPKQRAASIQNVFALRLAGGDARATARPAHEIAAAGLRGATQPLPHGAAIQRGFGAHDVGAIEAHVGGPAAQASAALGARAYACGGAVAFQSEPDLHTAAHEAAHVVQQRHGVQLAGGVGRAGDVYEQHADAVADRICAGESAEALLSAGPGGGAARAVQCADDPAAPAAGDAAAPSAPAAGDAAAPADPAAFDAGDILRQLEEAAQRGSDALWSVIDAAQDAALAALPQAGPVVLDALWPSSTGWRFSGNLQAAGFLGAAVGITLACKGDVSLTILRDGTTVELTIATEAGTGASGGAHLGLEGDVGVVPVRGAVEVELKTDLATVAWPSNLLDALRRLDARGALAGLLGLGGDYWQHTEVKVKGEEGMDLTGEIGVGTPAVGEVGVGGSAGVTVGAEETFAADRTVKVLTFDVGAAASVAAELSPSVRDALSGLQQDLIDIAPLLAPMARPIDPDAPALRHGDVLPGTSDSGNSVNADAKVGVKLRRTIPRDGSPETWEGGFTAGGKATVALLGQSASGGGDAEVMYAWDDFCALVRATAQNARAGLTGPAAAPVGATPTDVSVSGFVEVKLQDLTRCGVFPGLDIGSMPGVADRMDAAGARLDVSLKFDRTVIPGTPPPDLAAVLTEAQRLVEAHQIVDAIMLVVRTIPALGGTAPRTAIQVILEKLELVVSVTDEHFADQDSPGFKEIPSGFAQGNVSQSNLYRFTYGGSSPEFSPSALASVLVDLVL